MRVEITVQTDQGSILVREFSDPKIEAWLRTRASVADHRRLIGELLTKAAVRTRRAYGIKDERDE